MTLVDVYYKYQKEYSEKYGNKTIVLMEVGSFYEMYATKRFFLHKKCLRFVKYSFNKKK